MSSAASREAQTRRVLQTGGVIVPMVTPFTTNGRVDDDAVARMVDHILNPGVADLLLLGTTGEAASMGRAQRLHLLEAALQHVDGRARVFAGLASNSFEECVSAARAYHELGVTAVVAHLPNYYALGEAQMRAWFTRLADAASLPLFMYNIPMTTRMSIPVELVMELAEHENVFGIKDSEYDVARMEALIAWRRGRPDFAYFVGPSVMSLRGLELGADGFVPGVGNVVPDACHRLMRAARAGNWGAAAEAQAHMKRVGDTYQPNRGVGEAIALLKATLAALGLCGPTVLPPLLPAAERDSQVVAAALAALPDRQPPGG